MFYNEVIGENFSSSRSQSCAKLRGIMGQVLGAGRTRWLRRDSATGLASSPWWMILSHIGNSILKSRAGPNEAESSFGNILRYCKKLSPP